MKFVNYLQAAIKQKETLGIKIGICGLLLACLSFMSFMFLDPRIASPIACLAIIVFTIGFTIQLVSFLKSLKN